MFKYFVVMMASAILAGCSLSNTIEKEESNNIQSTPSQNDSSLKKDDTATITPNETITPQSESEAPDSGVMGIKTLYMKPVNELLNIKEGQKIYATLRTSEGDIEVELFADKTPKTVANFVGLSEGTQPWTDPKTGSLVDNKPLYNNIIFHRVIKQFMIQGGDPLGQGTGGPGYQFEDEIAPELTFNAPGLMAMANAGKGTNGSQFFITTVETPWLNGNHTIFGRVTKGMDIVTKIENVKTGLQDKPVRDVVINNILINRI